MRRLIFNKCLVKWREPKIKGMVTRANILTSIILILVVAIPFGFWGGSGKFSISIYSLALGFMSLCLAGLLIQPLLPGTQIQMREDAIVRPMPRLNQRSAYKDIDCCYLYRDCSISGVEGAYVAIVHPPGIDVIRFTRIEVVMKNKQPAGHDWSFSFKSTRSIGWFAVPVDVSLDRVLQILKDKGVKVVDPALPA